MRTIEQVEKEIEETKAALKDVHGTETEVYARIVGYYRAVKHWNKGKRDEFDLDHCKGCGICYTVCPFKAIEWKEVH